MKRMAYALALAISAGVAHAVPDGRYVVSDTVVRDRVTRLVWERRPALCDQPDPMTQVIGCDQATAAAYCDLLVLNGQSDWRLPTRYELTSLWDYSLVDFIGPQLLGRRPATYWSSTFWSFPRQNLVWPFAVDTYFGNADAAPPTRLSQVRCVRGPSDD